MEEFKETTSNTKRPSLVQQSEEAHKQNQCDWTMACERVNRVKHPLANSTWCLVVAWFQVL